MTVLRPGDFLNTGVVVEDLDAAIRSLSAIGGYRWTIANTYPFTVWTPEGEATIDFRFVDPMEAPHLELVSRCRARCGRRHRGTRPITSVTSLTTCATARTPS